LKWQEPDYFFMSRALQLARLGMNSSHPNPRVGCVIVRDDAIITEGWHEYAGGPHAEINALSNLSEKAEGASCYVTLEPCNHQGRTGPCTEALINAGIETVFAAMKDPNPLVSGKGLEKMQQAGVKTNFGLMQQEALKLNQGFVTRMTEKRPFVRCKMAMSLDGRTALASGESKWITESAAREDVQRLRAASAAIMTGIGTVLMDDPGLDVRSVDIGERQPVRIILDRKLRMPTSAKMLSLEGRTLIFTQNNDVNTGQALQSAGAELVLINEDKFLSAVMQHLAEHEQINEVLLEAGAELAGALLDEGLIDEFIIYQAPVLMGDKAKGLFHLPSIETMKDKLELEIVDRRMIGRDQRMTFKVNRK
jgi:diaminohydroxyphosphoribosylaminopyrimidine deaminase / 5-amino-6-(5-phosphoribosylamino)uracil reductase